MKGKTKHIKFVEKYTIREEGSTALYAACTVDTVYALNTGDTVYTVNAVDTVDMVYTVDMVDHYVNDDDDNANHCC